MARARKDTSSKKSTRTLVRSAASPPSPVFPPSSTMSKRGAKAKTVSDEKITHSIVVPAYKEQPNLRPLTTRLFAAFRDPNSPIPAEGVEVLIIDDNSRDGTVEEVDSLSVEGYNVRVIVRTTERGLSSAVVRGFQEAKGDAMLCMDADLQV
jgi:cellulose synthase/poly-beta-1,6-N-acetylglucosamine synthase-like glycosyltransferase